MIVIYYLSLKYTLKYNIIILFIIKVFNILIKYIEKDDIINIMMCNKYLYRNYLFCLNGTEEDSYIILSKTKSVLINDIYLKHFNINLNNNETIFNFTI